jgi:exopolysaccharide biosynthesis polyprenyl glycosylphosphotransferase
VNIGPLLDSATSDAERARGSDHAPSDIREARFFPSAGQLRSTVRRFGSIAALLAIDICGLAGALYLALVLRQIYYGESPILWGLAWDAEAHWLPFLTVVTVLVFWRAGLYAPRESRAGAGRIVSSLLLVTVITLAFAVGTGYQHTTFGLYATTFVLSVIVIGVLRASYESVTRDVWRLAGVRRGAVLVGDAARLADLRRALGRGRGGIDYEFLGALTPDAQEVPGLRKLGDLSALPSVLAELRPDELVVSSLDLDDEALLDLVGDAHRSGVKVRIAPTTTELLTQRAEYVPGQGVPLFELRPPVVAGVDWAAKRIFDVVVSTFLIVVATPLWVLIALAVKLDSRGPVFYRDRRVGLREREFGMFKFRSMYAHADSLQAGLEASNEASGPLFKIKDDPRVTRVGRLLRRYSIDELPQLLNVVRGEMSLVGPRPLPLRDFVQLEDWHRKRYLVLPGMTGLWQVSGRIDLNFDDLVRLDFYYLENWSIWLDISILVKTMPAVLARRGAY